MKIHGAPQGVTEYSSQAEWPFLSFQGHWKPCGPTPNPSGPLVPGIQHTHIEGNFPIWAELGAGPMTVPIAIKLFQTTGKIISVGGQFMGPNGPVDFSSVVMDQPLPLVGDPKGLVSFTGHATFDPALGTATISQHGSFNTRLIARTVYDNTDVMDVEAWIPYYSMLDTSQPETVSGEGFMEFATKCAIQQAVGIEVGAFGLHLTEFRGTDGLSRAYVPILAPFNAPEIIYPLTYNYRDLHTLFPNYELRLDGNFHMGVEGTLIDATSKQIPGGVSNVAVLDPVVIAASMPQMGTTPGKHRLIAMWEQETGAGSSGFGPNARLVSLLVFEVMIGDSPIPAPDPTTVVVPMVVGLTRSAATGAITAAKLMVGTVQTISHPTVPSGAVITQSPVAGSVVALLTMISVQISTGPSQVTPTFQPITPIVKRLGVPGQLSRFCLCVDGTDECVELMVGPDPEAS